MRAQMKNMAYLHKVHAYPQGTELFYAADGTLLETQWEVQGDAGVHKSLEQEATASDPLYQHWMSGIDRRCSGGRETRCGESRAEDYSSSLQTT